MARVESDTRSARSADGTKGVDGVWDIGGGSGGIVLSGVSQASGRGSALGSIWLRVLP